MKKDLGVIFGLFAIVILLLVFGGEFTSTSFLRPAKESTGQAKQSGLLKVLIKDLNIDAEVANTADSKKKGLSGRSSMEIARGMLFVFDKSSNYTFWMKDMKFLIDIIWIDENKKVVHIVENASPEPDKKDGELTRYASPNAAKYVLEINAGLSRLHYLQIGDIADFKL